MESSISVFCIETSIAFRYLGHDHMTYTTETAYFEHGQWENQEALQFVLIKSEGYILTNNNSSIRCQH